MASFFPRDASAARPADVPLGLGVLQPFAANEDQFRHLMEASPAISWAADADGRVTFAANRLFEYTGLQPGNDVRDWARLAVHPDDYPQRFEAWRHAKQDGGAFEIELRIRRADGVYRWFLVRAVALRGEDGRVERWFATATDIDERKRSEENLRFLAKASAALAEVTDVDDTLKRISRLAVPHFADWVEVTLREPAGAVRRVVVNHWDPKRVKEAEELYRRYPQSEASGALKVVRTGESIFIPDVSDRMLQGASRSGEHLHMLRKLRLRSFISVPMRSKTRVMGALSFATSESGRAYTEFDLRTAEELAHRATIALENAELVQALKEADRRKDEFLAVLAHELRNPLAPVRNAIEILRASHSPSPQLQWTHDVIDRQVRQMTRLVDDLLDVSRITSGKIELRKERVELAAAVRVALEASRPLVERGGHQLTVKLPPEPLWLNADLARLAQILSNLVNNAAKYTRPGGHIWLIAERRDSEVVIRVRDNGIGIEPRMLQRVFDMFAQVRGTADHSQGGLGIGLTLVKRLTELHGGRIEAHSDGPGRGSEFVVVLPLSSDEAANDPSAKDAVPALPVNPRRILVVDDNRDAADSLSMLLHARGHDVRVAYDGLEAVGAAITFQPDVVLLDIGLPKLYGYDAARRIRELRGKDVLLIAITGWGQEEDRRRAREAGFDHHLTKPVDPEAISRLIDAAGPKPS